MAETQSNVTFTEWHGGNKFAEWGPKNPCFGCGACCKNVRIPLSQIPYITRETLFGELLPHVVNPEESLELKEVPTEPGVYYAAGKEREYLVIHGACPLLGEEGECTAHDKDRPAGCVSSGTDSIKCSIEGRAHTPEYKKLIDP